MARSFKLPDLGEGIHEGEILKWYVEVGAPVLEDEALVDVETIIEQRSTLTRI